MRQISSVGLSLVSLLLLLLLQQLVAERAVRASSLVIKRQQSPAVAAGISDRRPGKAFQVYWNVPSFMCRKYHIEFPQLEQRFGILQNRDDQFQGDRIAILYDPGAFPALLQESNKNDTILVRNGGVPQEGDLSQHLQRFREHLEELVPEASFSGLGVIDMESWRPVFRQNWASLQIYRNYSLELEAQRQPAWPQSKLKQEAQRRFEGAARDFMLASLRLASKLRPKARWGYYAYPYCFNWSPNQQSSQCAPQVKHENDQLRWLFGGASILYPSVYLQYKLSAEQRLGMVRGRVQEALRVKPPAVESTAAAKVFVYFWFKYQDRRDTYVDKRDIVNAVTEMAKRGADGLVVWGSSNDLNSKSKCESFADYLDSSLGPALGRARQRIAAAAYRPMPMPI